MLRRLFPRRVLLVHSAFGMLHDKPSRMRQVYDPLFMGFMLRSVDVRLAQNEHEAQEYRDYCRRYRAGRSRVALLPLTRPAQAEQGAEAEATDARIRLRAKMASRAMR